MSPYPTVVIVTIAQYILIGMLAYPDFSPSIRYIKDPKTITIFNTAKKNMNIFLLLATNATIKRLASPIYLTNFNQSDAEANVFGTGTYNNASGSIAHTRFAGKYRDTSTQVDGIKLFFGGGNITKGNFRIYGVVNS